MGREKIVDAAKRVAGPVLESMGYELVDLRFVMDAGRWHLRFFIDKEGGVGLQDCETISREVDTLIEVEDFIKGPFVLEVSSPGLDRPLFTPRDFARFTGRLAKVRTKEKLEGQKVFIGRIEEPGESGFNLVAPEGGKVYTIEYAQVDTARLEVEF